MWRRERERRGFVADDQLMFYNAREEIVRDKHAGDEEGSSPKKKHHSRESCKHFLFHPHHLLIAHTLAVLNILLLVLFSSFNRLDRSLFLFFF